MTDYSSRRCEHCGVAYEVQISGEPEPHRFLQPYKLDGNLCPDCAKVACAALETVNRKFKQAWVTVDVDLNALQERREAMVRPAFVGAHGYFAKHPQHRGSYRVITRYDRLGGGTRVERFVDIDLADGQAYEPGTRIPVEDAILPDPCPWYDRYKVKSKD